MIRPPWPVPRGPEKDIGIWLALGGAGLMAVGAVLATTHISLAVEPRDWESVLDERRGRSRRPPPGPRPSSADAPGGPERP